MTEYIPTDEDIREYVEVGGQPRPWEEITADTEAADAARAAAFDRWMANHDAKVRAEALRSAADAIVRVPADEQELGSTDDWLRARAAKEENR